MARKFRIYNDDFYGSLPPIQPFEIKVSGKFSNHEVEKSVIDFIDFFKEKGGWVSFSFSELLSFYRKRKKDTNMLLFGVICPWMDDGSIGRLQKIPAYVVMNSDGRMAITSYFLDEIMRKTREK